MNGWCVLALVLLALFLLGQLRIGVRGAYTADGLTARARIGPVRIQLYPFKKNKKAPKAPKPQKGRMGPEKKSGGGAKPLLKLLPLALEAAEQFRRKLQVDVLYLEVTAGAPDPADAAMIYGRTNAALGAAWQLLNAAFHIKDGRAVVRVAFDREQTTVYGTLAMSIKLGQALWLVLYFGGRVLLGLLRARKEEKNNSAERRS